MNTIQTNSILVNSPEETCKVAKAFAETLKPGDVICLDGDLGAGKTTFSKFLIAALGVEELVTSPTFTIINEYTGKFPVYHFDVYRIQSLEEMYDLGYEEYFFGGGVCLVEWASQIAALVPENSIFIELAYGNQEEQRQITFFNAEFNVNFHDDFLCDFHDKDYQK